MKFNKTNTMCLWERIANEYGAVLSRTEQEAMRELDRIYAPTEGMFNTLFEYERLKSEIIARNWQMRQEHECEKAERMRNTVDMISRVK